MTLNQLKHHLRLYTTGSTELGRGLGHGLGRGLEANKALGLVSCFFSPPTTPSCNTFHSALALMLVIICSPEKS